MVLDLNLVAPNKSKMAAVKLARLIFARTPQTRSGRGKKNTTSGEHGTLHPTEIGSCDLPVGPMEPSRCWLHKRCTAGVEAPYWAMTVSRTVVCCPAPAAEGGH